MRPATLRALAGSALLSLAAQPVAADSSHRHQHSRHSGNHTHGGDSSLELVKRGKLVNRSGQCAFPEDAGLVTVTPGSLNKGWAMSPDQECTADSYCPYACPPGQLMNQWEPGSTYVYPSSMAGGLYCDKKGAITKPFPNKDYCVEGIGNVKAVNKCGSVVAVCQTVLPGNEAMIIPTSVSGSATIAVPGTSYWDSTAAHYYVNPPGYSTADACIWGDGTKPIGNWSPYVIGANQDHTGDTYLKLGYNPIYTDTYAGVKPTFGMKVECSGTCVGLPCIIDPGTDSFGKVKSATSATGAGGADFCVVTVTSGSASIVFFNTDGSTGSDKEEEPTTSKITSKAAAPKTPTTTKEAELETTTFKAVKVVGHNAEVTTPRPSPTPSSTATSSDSSDSKTVPTKEASTSKASTLPAVSSTSSPKSSSRFKSAAAKASASTGHGGIFQESDDATQTAHSAAITAITAITASADLADATSTAAAAATTTTSNNANKDQAAFAGLVVAIVAAACLY